MVNLGPVFPVLRAVQLVFAIIELGLSAYDVHSINSLGSECFVDLYTDVCYNFKSPGQLNFLVFASLWTMLAVPALNIVPRMSEKRQWNDMHVSIAMLSLEALTWVFWLAGFAAFASLYGSGAGLSVAQATLAFAVLEWLLFTATLILASLVAAEVLPALPGAPGSLKRGQLGAGGDAERGVGGQSAPVEMTQSAGAEQQQAQYGNPSEHQPQYGNLAEQQQPHYANPAEQQQQQDHYGYQAEQQGHFGNPGEEPSYYANPAEQQQTHYPDPKYDGPTAH